MKEAECASRKHVAFIQQRRQARILVPEAQAATPEQWPRAVFPGIDDPAFGAIGDTAKIREVMRGYGALTGMSITNPRFAP